MPVSFDHTRIRVPISKNPLTGTAALVGLRSHAVRKITLRQSACPPTVTRSSHKLELTTRLTTRYRCPKISSIPVYESITLLNTALLEGLELEIDLWPTNWREKFESGKKMAFITDPDGYEVEILEHIEIRIQLIRCSEISNDTTPAQPVPRIKTAGTGGRNKTEVPSPGRLTHIAGHNLTDAGN